MQKSVEDVLQLWCQFAVCFSDIGQISASGFTSHQTLGVVIVSSVRVNEGWLCDQNFNTFGSDTLAPPRPPKKIKLDSFVNWTAAYRFVHINHDKSRSVCAAADLQGGGEEEGVKYNSPASAPQRRFTLKSLCAQLLSAQLEEHVNVLVPAAALRLSQNSNIWQLKHDMNKQLLESSLHFPPDSGFKLH